jgi:hypothetical protein
LWTHVYSPKVAVLALAVFCLVLLCCGVINRKID